MTGPIDGENTDEVRRMMQGTANSASDITGFGSPREDGVSFAERSDVIPTDIDNPKLNGEAGANIDGESHEKNAVNAAWSQGLDTPEMIDDPVRMYLREIGRVSLLKAAEERVLARKMEASKHIEFIESELTSPESRPARPWQVVLQLITRTTEGREIAGVLSRYVGLKGERTLREIRSDPAFLEVLDGEMAEELLNFGADILNKDPLEVRKDIQNLSLDSRTLPAEVSELVDENLTLKKIKGQDDKVALCTAASGRG